MRRLLLCIAALIAGGCQCFDGAYDRFCDAGRCDPRGIGINLSVDEIARAQECRPFTLLLLEDTDAGRELLELWRPINVGIEDYPTGSIDVHETEGCNGIAMNTLTFTQPRRNLFYETRQVGRVTLTFRIDAGQLDQDIMSLGRLVVSPTSFYLPVGSCEDSGVTATFTSVSDLDPGFIMPVAGEIDVTLLMQNGVVGRDVDGGCSSRPTVRFDDGGWQATIALGATMASTSSDVIQVDIAATPFVGPTGAHVGAGCSPPGMACGLGMGCCSDTDCDGGLCRALVGRRCYSGAACVTLNCDFSNLTCQ